MARCLALSLVLSGCRLEYGVQSEERLDVFRQNRLDAIDLLLVIDNSCSMVDEQDHLAASFQALMGALTAGQSDWRLAVTTSEPALSEYRGELAGGTDEIILDDPTGRELDRVTYDDRIWTLARGVPFERCGLEQTALAFQQATASGTPGEPNPCAPAVAAAPDEGPRPPEPGEVVVSEFLPWAERDALCEWVELANLTPHTLDLSHAVLRDDGRDRLILPAGTRLDPGGVLLVGGMGEPEACGQPFDLATDRFHLAHGLRWVDAQTPHAEAVFSELVAVGTGAFGLEMGMENALVTLTRQQQSKPRSRFLRERADLALLFFSDEDDLSPGSVAHYVDALRALKGVSGQRESHRVRIGAAVGTEPALPGEPSCRSERGEALYAERYLALAEQSGGLTWSICGDLSQVAEQAGLTFTELLFEFRLSAVPSLETLVVEEYASEDEDSYVGPLIRDEDFTLAARESASGQDIVMLFPEGRIPPGSVVTVTYEVLPETAVLDLGAP